MGNGELAKKLNQSHFDGLREKIKAAEMANCWDGAKEFYLTQLDVNEFVVNGRNEDNAQEKSQPFWKEWANRAPYAFAMVVITAMILFQAEIKKFFGVQDAKVMVSEVIDE